MAESSSTTINTDQIEVGGDRTENIPVQFTTICLNKENYLQWSAAITMGIAGRGRIAYINERKIEPAETNVEWDTWFLEDNQVKTWIVNSVSSDIQPFILRKRTARDLWVRDVAKEWENRVFLFLVELNDDFEGRRSQILNSEELFSIEDVYSRVEAEEQRHLVISGRKGDHTSYNERSALVSRAPEGAARPPRKCTHCIKTGHTMEFCWDLKGDHTSYNERSALVSRAPMGAALPPRKCTHCKKTCHTMEFCWDLHPEKKNSRGRSSNGKKPESDATNSSGGKASISAEQIRELHAYLSQIDVGHAKASDDVNVNHALAISGEKCISCTGEWIVDSGATNHMTGNLKLFHEYKLSSGKEHVSLVDVVDVLEHEKVEGCSTGTEEEHNHLFGQVYSKRKVRIDKVTDAQRRRRRLGRCRRRAVTAVAEAAAAAARG
ncbi:hypothetical protein EJ110_NYTH56604 [Nymphaea thermarum]|nr:hypothetical protein EJ110_NYTH56604 [Nymphaea thermarum]